MLHLIVCPEQQWKPACTTAIHFLKVARTSESRFSRSPGCLRLDPYASC